jgi:hypothetical protein
MPPKGPSIRLKALVKEVPVPRPKTPSWQAEPVESVVRSARSSVGGNSSKDAAYVQLLKNDEATPKG